jgi:hypothetical protein
VTHRRASRTAPCYDCERGRRRDGATGCTGCRRRPAARDISGSAGLSRTES